MRLTNVKLKNQQPNIIIALPWFIIELSVNMGIIALRTQ